MAQQLQYQPQSAVPQAQQGWSQSQPFGQSQQPWSQSPQQASQMQPWWTPQTQAQSAPGQQAMGQQFGQRFDESVPFEIQQAVRDLDRLETVAEWARERAVERGRPRAAARLADLAEVAHQQKNLLVRQSPSARSHGQAIQQTIQEAIQELQQHASEPEFEEAVRQAQQTAQNVQQSLGRIQQIEPQSQRWP